MSEEQATQETVVTRDLEKGRDGSALNRTVTISAELYEKVVIPLLVRFAHLVALSQPQKHRRWGPSSTFRKSYSLGTIRVIMHYTIPSDK
jgi:hypothetical protein